MKRWLTVGWAVVVTFLVLQGSGVVPAIVPQLVPTANKRGNSTIFSLASSTTPAAAGTAYCDDGSGNLTTSGCSSGGSGTPGSTLFSSTTTAGPNNTASETSLIGTVTGSKTIAANTFTNGAVLEVYTQGFFSLPAVADSLTLKVKCGTTVLGSASFTPAAGILTNGTFRLWLLLTARGSGGSGSLMTNGLAELSGSSLTATESKVLNATAVSFDFTTSCAMDVTAQWGAAQTGELISGTNVAAWFPGAPVTSVAGLTGAVPGQGTDSSVLTSGTVSGTASPLCTDANGGATTSGCPAGGGIPYLTLTDPTTVTFSWFNQGSATVTTRTKSLYLTGPVSGGGNPPAIHGRQITEPATPMSITIGLIAVIQGVGFNACGLYVSDGTKVATIGINAQTSPPSDVQVNYYDNVTTYNSTPASNSLGNYMTPLFLKVLDDGVNLTWYWSPNGVDLTQIFQQARTTFLTPANVGFYSNANNSTTPDACLLVSWLQGTS